MSHEPTNEEVESFIRDHPSGGTLEEVAAAMGVTRQRADQIIRKAVEKAVQRLRAMQVRSLDDVV